MADVLRKPSPLHSGDRVALVAPSGTSAPTKLDAGIKILESWGLEVVSLLPEERLRYLAGSDAERAGRLLEAFTREDVRAVLPVRGGYGAARLFEMLDIGRLRAHPKIVVGFSDATLLLNRLVREASLATFHGPMPGADLPKLSAEAAERFRCFLFGEEGWWNGAGCEPWRAGSSEGRLAGGCLSVLVTTLGTPYEIDTDGAILFLEDVAEKPYRIDRMLTHLKHAGKLRGVRGVVVGSMLDCDDGEGIGALREIFLDVIADPSIPILYGLDAGHGSGNVVLPLGCRVRIANRGARLDVLEPVFA